MRGVQDWQGHQGQCDKVRDWGLLNKTDLVGLRQLRARQLHRYEVTERFRINDGRKGEKVRRLVTFNEQGGALISEDAATGHYSKR